MDLRNDKMRWDETDFVRMLIISITSGVVSFLVAYNLIRSFSIVSNWVVGYTSGQVDHHSSHYQLPIVSNQTSDDDKFKLKKRLSRIVHSKCCSQWSTYSLCPCWSWWHLLIHITAPEIYRWKEFQPMCPCGDPDLQHKETTEILDQLETKGPQKTWMTTPKQ